jgi:hypothetical protein
MSSLPRPLAADDDGNIFDLPGVALARLGPAEWAPLDPGLLVPLPEASRLHALPGRSPLALGKPGSNGPRQLEGRAVAAFLPPGWLSLAHAAWQTEPGAPELPLFAYTALCWYRGRFHAAARRIDPDPKHDPERVPQERLARQVRAWQRRFPENRLVRHHGRECALRYGCPNAQNLFLGRDEAPIAVARACNAVCVGCISEQPPGGVPSSQERIEFLPRLDEILEIALPHLERAPRAMLSFGQGCEGEPLLQAGLIEEALRAIRARTARGTLHLNTNGSRPDALRRLAAAGLDSVRISTNSARPGPYTAYYRPRTYAFADVAESVHAARAAGLFTSLNYLCFAGETDREDEREALVALARSSGLAMIQWRNLNIDPDRYVGLLADHEPASPRAGMLGLLDELRERLPDVRFGCFNPPRESWGR